VLTGVAGMGSAMTETTRRMSYDREQSYFPYLARFVSFPEIAYRNEKEAVSLFDFSISKHFSQDAL